MTAFAIAIDQIAAHPAEHSAGEWLFHVSGTDIAEQVRAAGAQVATAEPANYAFISLRAA